MHGGACKGTGTTRLSAVVRFLSVPVQKRHQTAPLHGLALRGTAANLEDQQSTAVLWVCVVKIFDTLFY